MTWGMLVFVGAVVVLLVKSVNSGKITVHDERLNRFASDVDRKLGNVFWRGPHSKRRVLLLAALLVGAYFYSPIRLAVTWVVIVATAILVIKHWGPGTQRREETRSKPLAAAPPIAPEPPIKPDAPEPARPQNAPGVRPRLSRPIPPLPRIPRNLPQPVEHRDGFLSVILPAFGVLCLIVGGGFALLVTSGERSPRVRVAQRSVRPRLYEDKLAILRDGEPLLADTIATTVVNDTLATPAQDNVAPNSTATIAAEEPLDYQVGKQRIYFVSSLHSDVTEAQAEVDDRLIAYLRDALGIELGITGTSRWEPDAGWIRKHFVFSEEKVPHEGESAMADFFRIKVGANLDPAHLDVALERFHTDQAASRMKLLAKAYAGTVSILGALAIFLRLGTGIHPGHGAGVGIGRGINRRVSVASPPA